MSGSENVADAARTPGARPRRPFMIRFRNVERNFSMSLSFRTDTEPEPRQVIEVLREVIRELESSLDQETS
jgi:hypothetical protein